MRKGSNQTLCSWKKILNKPLQQKQVQCRNGPLVLKLTSQTGQQSEILQTDWPRVFSSIIQNSMIFFVASVEAKINLIPHIVFKFFKFKTSHNLVG